LSILKKLKSFKFINFSRHENVKKNFYLGFMVIFSLGCGSLVALKFWDIATRFPDVPQTGTLSDVFLFEFKPLFFVYMGLCNSLSILFYIAIFVSVHRQTGKYIFINLEF